MGFAIARLKGVDASLRGLWPGAHPTDADYLPTISWARATNAGEAA
jgi:hypothetical protein